MSSATVSSAQTPSFYSIDGTMRFNGTEFASGLDTQGLIKALTANITSQIDKEKQLEQKASWRRDAFRAVEDLLQKFSDTYFSYSTNSPLNIMSREFFDSEDLISSNSSIVSATGAQSDAGNVVIDKISQIATAATYTGGKVSNESIDSTEALGSTISAGSYLSLKVNGKTYTLSLGANIDTKKQNSDGSWTNKDFKEVASDLAKQLNTQAEALNKSIKNATDQNATVAFTTDGNGSIKLTGATVLPSSTNFANGLGEGRIADGATTFTLTDGTNGTNNSIAALTNLGDQLAGTTLTVQLDGLSKTITFTPSERSQYNASDNGPNSVGTYLQKKMDDAFGKTSDGRSKVNVTMSDGKLSLTTPTDSSSVLQFNASSSGVLGYDGLLHIRSGETNRLELDKTLDELAQYNELPHHLSSSYTIKDKDKHDVTAYKLVVNGKEFTFDKNTELNTVINTINDDSTADVNISYSQTLNQFRIVSDDTGAQENVSVGDEEGNLASALFGISTVSSGNVSAANYNNTSLASTYNLTLSDGTQGTINVNGNSSYTSLSNLAQDVQTSVNGTALRGHVTVGVSSDGKSLTFETADSSLKIARTTTNDILSVGDNAVLSSSTIVSGDVTAPDYQSGELLSTYQFTLNGGTPVSININGASTYNSVNDLATAVQNSINGTALNGHVTVGVSSDSKSLTFAAAGSTLSIAKATNSDILGFGNNSQTTTSTNPTIASVDVTSVYNNSNSSSFYQFTLGDGTSAQININGASTYSSVNDLATAVQNSINGTALNGHVTVGVIDGKLTFNTAAGSTLSIAKATNNDILGFGSNIPATIPDGSSITSGDVTTPNYQNSSLSSVYQFTLNDGTSTQTDSITVNGASTYASPSALAAGVQTLIDNNNTLKGHNITVGVSADGKSLTFKAAAGSTLSIKKIPDPSTHTDYDILGLGDTTVSAHFNNSYTAGKDLSMSVNLGGTERDITRSTNSFTLDGVTLHVTGQTKDGDSPIKFSASNNVDDLYKKVSDFVDKYNEIVDKINTDVATMPATQSTNNGGGTVYDPLTDDQKKTMTDTEITDWNKKAQQGLLFCDPQMSALQTDIRTAMEGNVNSVGMSLASIGISTAPLDTTSGGKLIINTTRLKEVLHSDPDKVAQLFTNADGIASRVKNVIKKNIGEFSNDGALFDVAGSSSMIGADNSEIGMEITNYDKNIKDLQTQLKDKQDSLQAKFTNMEMIISQLSSQYTYMSSMASS